MSRTDRAKLVDRLYAFLSNPELSVELIHELDPYIEAAGSSSADAPELGAEVERHFEYASRIFDRIRDSDPPSDEAAAHGAGATWVLDRDLLVIAQTPSAEALFGTRLGKGLDALGLPSDAIAAARRFAGEDAAERDGALCLSTKTDETPEQHLFVLTPSASSAPRAAFELRMIELSWRDDVGQQINAVFGLSGAEQDVLRAIVTGTSLPELAENRSRSIATVRTQAKSLFRKTGRGSQIEMIRLFAGLSIALSDVTEFARTETPGMAGFETVQLAAGAEGRRFEVDIFGPEEGDPVILMHGLFSGSAMIAAADDAMRRHNLRIFVPWRPGYATSVAAGVSSNNLVDVARENVDALIAAFEIDRPLIAGRFSGAIHAAATARRLNGDARGLLLISPTEPVRHVSKFDNMSAFQRRFAVAAYRLPVLVPVLARATRMFARTRGMEAFTAAFYPSPAADRTHSGDPAVRQLLATGIERSFQKTALGHELDLRLTASDWSQYLEGLNCNRAVIHGELDPCESFSRVAAEAERHGFEVTKVAGGGQLFTHAEPDLVFAEMRRLIDLDRT
ncbi:MAG: alpha/beta hydrolase [Hyphomicrobiaceae bacterium]|nr:alpha/beta hydrolase [Hyphomicrobiaceae bacterium]